MKNVLGLVALLLVVATSSSFAETNSKMRSFVEFEKTDTLIDLDATFPTCGPHKFNVQDGAMNYLEIEGKKAVRFIVKQYSANDIKLHLVTDKKYVMQGKEVAGLMIGLGVNILSSPMPVEMKGAGIERFAFKGTRKLVDPTIAASKMGSTPVPQVAMQCCNFRACGGVAGQFCSSGAGCGGDDCGMCCVSGAPGKPF
jgi:hypothetical protein